MSEEEKEIKTHAPRQPPWPAPLVAPLPQGRFAKNEEWAWARIANGQDANMAHYPGDEADPKGGGWLIGQLSALPDPSDGSSFKLQHKLSELFLRTILFHEPWASARERPSVQVFRALIEEAIDWSARETKGPIRFSHCRFEGTVDLRSFHVRGHLSIQHSMLAGTVTANGLQTDGALLCHGLVADKDIELRGARIGAQVNLSGATLKGTFDGDAISISSHLLCSDGFSCVGAMSLRYGTIGGAIGFDSAKLDGGVRADRLNARSGIYLRGMKHCGEIDLSHSNIALLLALGGSSITGKVDLTGATIAGELNLDTRWGEELKDAPPNWSDGAKLILRNSSAASLAGRLDGFRRKRAHGSTQRGGFVDMDLTGFQYERLGGFKAEHKDTLAAAEVSHLIAWLEAGSGDGAFNPDPYRRLARALEASGDTDKARRILRAMARHEHGVAKGWRRIPFFFSWLFIRYGYSNLTALGWFLALVISFTALGLNMEGLRSFDFSAAGFAEPFRWLGFSFANAVPLISLDRAHETFLAAQFGTVADPSSVPVGVAWVFYGEKVLGFIILSYLAAGLSGLARGRLEKD